jgi:hypothetical protein
MRNAVSVARKAKRLDPSRFNEISLSLENSLHVSPDSLTGCIVNKPSESPSRTIRRAIDILNDLQDKRETTEVLKSIKRHFRAISPK